MAASKGMKTFRKVVIVLTLAMLFVLPLWGRSLYEFNLSLEAGLLARDQGNSREAIRALARSLRWRAPLNFFATRAQGELLNMEPSLEGEEKIFLLRELRRALYMSRSYNSQSQDEAALIARIDSTLVEVGARSPVTLEPLAPPKISFLYQFLSQLTFWGWVCSVFATIRFGFSNQGERKSGKLILLLGGSTFLLVLWLLMLGNA